MSQHFSPLPSARSSASSGGPLRPPHRDGWIEVHEELQRVALLETATKEFVKRWAVLRDCWLYMFEEEQAMTHGREADHVVSINLRGSLCQRHPTLQRTFSLESSALFTIQGQRHVYLLRTSAEHEVEQWLGDINRSAIWDMVLRAAASNPKKKRVRRSPSGVNRDDDASSVAASQSSQSSRASSRASARSGNDPERQRAQKSTHKHSSKTLEEIDEATEKTTPVANTPAKHNAKQAVPQTPQTPAQEASSPAVSIDKIHISVSPDPRLTEQTAAGGGGQEAIMSTVKLQPTRRNSKGESSGPKQGVSEGTTG
eukprot:CAMPEP_0181331470 /NCGR_PEP_ID=MMETSP1101-20121128/24517_1 /TAXON_ID=46948 /ORGANISM="Rhodomonas abbreviata, Strain Caron Lab Isolate" /LENGTH=312 /DNA_ID=CAMNT_0023440929 /DNA_START=63 /DNA_END=997 /DNA_ORIENTATION=+